MVGPLLLLAVACLALSIGQDLHVGIGALSTVVAVVGHRRRRCWLRDRGWRVRFGRPLAAELGLDAVFVRAVPAVTMGAARMVDTVDADGIDVYPRGGAWLAQRASWLIGAVQSARVQVYATIIAGGALLVVIGALSRGWARDRRRPRRAARGRRRPGRRCRRGSPAARAAVTGAVASLAALVLLALVPRGGTGETWGEIDHAWIEPLGARLHVGVDGISLPLALLTAFLTLLCCLWLLKPDTSPLLVALLLVVAAASIGVFVSLDLLLFFVFFELALIPMWFVIARWGAGGVAGAAGGHPVPAVHRHRVGAAAGRHRRHRPASRHACRSTRSAAPSRCSRRASSPSAWRSRCRSCRCTPGCRTPTAARRPSARCCWPASSSSSAPTDCCGSTSRCCRSRPRASRPTSARSPWSASCGPGLACLVQDDLKRLVAYSSIGHMGFVVLGLATMSQTGIAAAVFGSVAHGLITGLLFFLAGSLKERYGTASLAPARTRPVRAGPVACGRDPGRRPRHDGPARVRRVLGRVPHPACGVRAEPRAR